jgi:phenylacetate-coenzyme A ligase PaaK-like adenylate-forming protein
MLRAVLFTNEFYRRKLARISAAELGSVDDLRKIPFATKHECGRDQIETPPSGTLPRFELKARRFFKQ